MRDGVKILFLDLDGTLLNSKKEITPKNFAAIRAALQAGHKIVLASGRATVSVENVAKKIGLTEEGCYAVTYNGACIYDLYRRENVYTHPLSLEVTRNILEAAENFGIYAHTYLGSKILTAHNTKELTAYSGSTWMDYQVVEDVCAHLTRGPEKILVIDYDDHQHLLDFQETVMPRVQGQAESFFSCPYYLEFVSPGVSKGDAVRRLCGLLGIPIENSIAAGDAENDISMIQAAHVGVVMKNAGPAMYAYGNYVTENDNNHDAIAEIISRFVISSCSDENMISETVPAR